MVVFNTFFSTVYLAVVYASVAHAAPSTPSSSYASSTHRVHEVGRRGLKVVAYSPSSSYETFDNGIAHPLSNSFTQPSLKDSTVAFIKDRLKVDTNAISYRTGFSAESTSYAYVRQQHDGIEFANSVANVAFRDSKVVAFGNSFVQPKDITASTPTVSVGDATATAEEALDGKHNGFEPQLQYLVMQDGSAALAHVIQIESDSAQTTYQAYVHALTGELVSVVDFTAHASYYVLPITKETPDEGFQTLKDPQDLKSSPKGWHDSGSGPSDDTSGNNAICYAGPSAETVSQSGPNLVFNYHYNVNKGPTVPVNMNASRTNAFYIVNSMHDIWYRYGFTEEAANFQANNFGKGGKGGDAVQISVQDSLGMNNAGFTTFPEGQAGLMRMFLWDMTTPHRDGALENDIVIHEYGHGLSNRLTGGGTGSCLTTTESGGMGEGWSDALADWTKQNGTIVDYQMGLWVRGGTNARTHPYSTSTTVNPLKYSDIAASNEVHNIGEIWANMLHNVLAALVKEHGYSKDAKTNPDSTGGNSVFLHLLIDSLKLQPCNPTFVSARDAWIQADANRYGGANKCLLWKVFASKGLGSGAKAGKYTDSTTVPSGC